MHPLPVPPPALRCSLLPRPGSIHHARASHRRVDVCTDDAVASHDAPHHDAHSWRGHVHNCGVCTRARRPTTKRKNGGREGREEETGRAVSKPVRNSGREQRDRAGSPLSLARPPSPDCFGCSSGGGGFLPPRHLTRRISPLAQKHTEEIHGRDLVPFRNAERRVKINLARVSSRRYLRVGESRDVFTMKIARVARGEHHKVRGRGVASGYGSRAFYRSSLPNYAHVEREISIVIKIRQF